MRVSVICAADRPDRLPGLVWSLKAQSHRNWELLILDQTTTGDVTQHLGSAMFADTRIKAMTVPYVGDWGQTVKEAAARDHSSGEALMFPADDAYYVPVALARMVETLERGADLVLCGWLYDLLGYVPMPPNPTVGYVDVGGFMVRRALFLEHGWPSKAQTGDGDLVVGLVRRPGVTVATTPGTYYVKN